MDENKNDVLNEPEKANETTEKTENKTNIRREIFSWIMVVVVAYILAFCITHFVIIKTEVISGSMISTLNIDDRVIGNRLAYVFSDPQRGDIIFFEYPLDESKTYVKRVIGCPGDTVEIANGAVYINGSEVPLDEPYTNGQKTKADGTFIEKADGKFVVPENCYFALGDNRGLSKDSRDWGYVSRDEILAKAWLRYKPSIDLVKSARYE